MPPPIVPNALTEEDILKPVPPGEDSDAWPCYVLREATIYNHERNALVNLLEAELHGPFILQGILHVEKKHRSRILINPEAQIVEFTSESFSVDDGQQDRITIWAGTKSGWLEIVPSTVYEEEYKNMTIAVKLWYSIVDCIKAMKGPRKNNNTLEVDRIFDAYSAKEHNSALDREDIAELCRIHGVFLLSMMHLPKNSREWKGTSIYKWLVQELPDIIPRLEEGNGRRPPKSNRTYRKPNSKQTTSSLPFRHSVDLPLDDDSNSPPNSSTKRRVSGAKSRKSASSFGVEEIAVDPKSRRSRTSGKGATLRLVTPNKRPRYISGSEHDENVPTKPLKRQRHDAPSSTHQAEEEPLEEESEEEDDDDEVEEDVPPEGAEEELDVKAELHLMWESLDMRPLEPVGPNGLWKCPGKECEFFLHGVEDEEVQEQIRKHFLRHADDSGAHLARLKLVKEQAKPHLPVTHLLEKVRRAGQAARLEEEAEVETIAGKKVPKPIKRRLPA